MNLLGSIEYWWRMRFTKPNQTQHDGRTVYQVFQAGERKMLESGAPPPKTKKH